MFVSVKDAVPPLTVLVETSVHVGLPRSAVAWMRKVTPLLPLNVSVTLPSGLATMPVNVLSGLPVTVSAPLM